MPAESLIKFIFSTLQCSHRNPKVFTQIYHSIKCHLFVFWLHFSIECLFVRTNPIKILIQFASVFFFKTKIPFSDLWHPHTHRLIDCAVLILVVNIFSLSVSCHQANDWHERIQGIYFRTWMSIFRKQENLSNGYKNEMIQFQALVRWQRVCVSLTFIFICQKKKNICQFVISSCETHISIYGIRSFGPTFLHNIFV
jgi:hypothetical protein